MVVTRMAPGRSSATSSSSSVGHAHDERRHPAGGHDEVGLVTADHGQGEGPPDPAQCGTDGTDQATGRVEEKGRFDQVGQHLGVGLGLQVVLHLEELVRELMVVLDDPVVDQGDATGAVHVRMGVGHRWSAVGGPPGVADPGDPRGRGHGCLFGQLVERLRAVCRPAPPQAAVAPRGDQGDAGRVIASVLQPGQAFEQDVECVVAAGHADDAAHGLRGYLYGRP
jgi:hypothetical protein